MTVYESGKLVKNQLEMSSKMGNWGKPMCIYDISKKKTI